MHKNDPEIFGLSKAHLSQPEMNFNCLFLYLYIQRALLCTQTFQPEYAVRIETIMTRMDTPKSEICWETGTHLCIMSTRAIKPKYVELAASTPLYAFHKDKLLEFFAAKEAESIASIKSKY